MTQKEPRAQCTSIWSDTGPEARTGEGQPGFLLEELGFLLSVPFAQQQEKLTAYAVITPNSLVVAVAVVVVEPK